MRLATYIHDGEQRTGAVIDDRLVDPFPGQEAPAMRTVIERWSDYERVFADADRAGAVPIDTVELLAPVPDPRKIICVGENYAAHVAEGGGSKATTQPELFPKWATALVGPYAPVVRPTVSEELDYEVELAVIIGPRTRHVSEAEALDAVFGYTVLNDVSVRDYQRAGSQWTAGKTFDSTTPMGPWIVTRDEIPDPQALELSLTVDGVELQRSTTAQMMRPVAKLISFLSTVLTLEPGDVIATGTPEGVGLFRQPPVWLRPGQTMVTTVSSIGSLRNVIVDETTR